MNKLKKRKKNSCIVMLAALALLVFVMVFIPGASAVIWPVLKVVLLIVGAGIFAAAVSIAILHQ